MCIQVNRRGERGGGGGSGGGGGGNTELLFMVMRVNFCALVKGSAGAPGKGC